MSIYKSINLSSKQESLVNPTCRKKMYRSCIRCKIEFSGTHITGIKKILGVNRNIVNFLDLICLLQPFFKQKFRCQRDDITIFQFFLIKDLVLVHIKNSTDYRRTFNASKAQSRIHIKLLFMNLYTQISTCFKDVFKRSNDFYIRIKIYSTIL